MSTHAILCHYNEITLKGKNRPFFENALIKMLEDRIARDAPDLLDHVRKPWGVLLFDLTRAPSKNEWARLESIFHTTFGVANYALAEIIDQDIEKIKHAALLAVQERSFTTFRVATRRTQKDFYLTSQDINIAIGTFIQDNIHKQVQLKDPEVTIHVDLIDDQALLFIDKHNGPGGLPHGTGGKALALLSGGIDSPVAAYLAFKKGLVLDMIHFHSVPYTSPASIQKVKQLVELLTPYQSSIKLSLVPLAEIQREITKKCPEKYRIILFRRFMMRISERIAQKNKAQALITGESIGQVASQTLENISVIENAVKLPILRPLITYDKEEIMQLARSIRSYETSLIPHEDCCTLFTPKRPETKAKTDPIERSESALDIETLITKACNKLEVIHIDH